MPVECPLVRPPYPAPLVERSRALLDGIVGGLRLDPRSRVAVDWVRTRHPGHAAQIDRLGEELGVDPTDLTLANICYDLTMALLGCSTLALVGGEGPVLARNMDWLYPELVARASCITPLPAGLSAGFVGAVGVVSGLSECGFAVVLNAVAGGAPDLAGYPVLLFLRHLLDSARSFEQAVDLASRTPLASPALLTFVGTENRQRVCVERSPRDCRQRWPAGDEPLVVTNHYLRLAAPDVCPRYDYLTRHAPRLPAGHRDEALLGLLNHPSVRQEITAQHVIARPAAGTLRLFVPADLLDHRPRPGSDLEGLRRLL
jgi:hypothetical protein